MSEKTDKEEKPKPSKPSVRIGWGQVKPGTKIEPNKKKPKPRRKEKHKKPIE